MSEHYDTLETRSAQERADDIKSRLPAIIAAAKKLNGNSARLAAVDPDDISSPVDLQRIPVLRKGEVLAAQTDNPPLGGFGLKAAAYSHVFQSPGPIYEPGNSSGDFWRFGRAAYAAGLRGNDIVQNCFSYHFTPAGMMFDSAAKSIGATVFPAGVGQTELQARAAQDIGVTAYAGTPDYLKVILEKADEDGRGLKITKAIVSGGALFPAMRAAYGDRGISCLQCYGTADVGLIAYESSALEGMILDEDVIVEIVRPGTGDPVPEGDVGEVVVTVLNLEYPLIRFATGDMSAILAGQSPCGRTNTRIKGWMGRADQTAKVKGMFVRPEQIAEFVSRNADVVKARVVVSRAGDSDNMDVIVESESGDATILGQSIRDILKLGGNVEIVRPGSIPNDGLVIEDRRTYD